VNDVPAVGKEHLGYVLDVDVEAHARRRYRSLPSPDQRTSRNRIADDGDPSPLGLLATRPLSTAPSSIMADVVTHSPSAIILHLVAVRPSGFSVQGLPRLVDRLPELVDRAPEKACSRSATIVGRRALASPSSISRGSPAAQPVPSRLVRWPGAAGSSHRRSRVRPRCPTPRTLSSAQLDRSMCESGRPAARRTPEAFNSLVTRSYCSAVIDAGVNRSATAIAGLRRARNEDILPHSPTRRASDSV
jgi:hypothetical protein